MKIKVLILSTVTVLLVGALFLSAIPDPNAEINAKEYSNVFKLTAQAGQFDDTYLTMLNTFLEDEKITNLEYDAIVRLGEYILIERIKSELDMLIYPPDELFDGEPVPEEGEPRVEFGTPEIVPQTPYYIEEGPSHTKEYSI